MTAYHRPIPILWWTERWSYLLFVLRELSSVFVAWFVVYLLLLINAISDGPAAYDEFVERSGHWWVVAINVIALLFVLLHTVTWFGLAPKAMVVKLQGRRVPPRAILAAHYAAWLLLSAITAWVILR
ncbi:fumarate reductase subunit C [Kribbella sp. VKM Ac-2527]|uniref:Fumarate reductase subunit C n=1 Tax=Kribbella caucasensis TaxID=2512215 RepID=A0A4R6K964_9ACTN|nr:fumarate reductase subunit C [Kribbella sp. VKM Ac-2527]TDO44509.1 fumarate reductase subunit C [Kribbella sp. VKM Ac-2527]